MLDATSYLHDEVLRTLRLRSRGRRAVVSKPCPSTRLHLQAHVIERVTNIAERPDVLVPDGSNRDDYNDVSNRCSQHHHNNKRKHTDSTVSSIRLIPITRGEFMQLVNKELERDPDQRFGGKRLRDVKRYRHASDQSNTL